MTEPVIEARGVRVRYDATRGWACRGVDLRVEPGQFVLLLGPSGCGKSTFSLTLNGLVPHSVPAELRGRVHVLGRDTRDTAVGVLTTTVGMVFQDPDAQIVTGTVLDEVCFGLENTLVPVDEIEPRAVEALERAGLGDRLRDDPVTLSGGGRQRLALACALAMNPAVVVLDEPTANLDPAAAQELYEWLAKVGETVVLIEHDLDDVIARVNRVVVLDAAGTVQLSGPPREVFGAHSDRLDAIGVWLPTAVLVARRLTAAGVRLDTVPLTLEELADALRPLPTLPPLRARRAAPGAPAVTAPDITVRRLTVRYGERVAVDDVSMSIAPGDFLAIVGVNGAGKTTLAQAVAGVRVPPPGAVRLGSVDLARMRARERGDLVGFVFQNPEHQFVTDSVFDELAHGLRVRRVPEDEVGRRVASLLERLHLDDCRDASPFTLSHGQKRRLSVGTALISGPRLLVLDEPTFGQDRRQSEELLGLLRRLNSQGRTVVVVTHDMQLVAEHARHVAVLSEGRLLTYAPTEDVLGQDRLLREAGLRPPPIRRFATSLAGDHPEWADLCRLGDLPGHSP